MTLTRTVRIAGLLALAAAGCGKPPAAAPSGAKPVVDIGKGGPAPAATGSPEAFARDFLKAVADGTATPAMLTPGFKKLIAEPVFEADKAQGYSDHGAETWLAGLKGKAPMPTLGPVYGGGDAAGFVATGVGPGGPVTVTLRVVNDTGWKADWLLVTPAAAESQPPAAAGDAGAAAFTAAAFLHALTMKQDALAVGLLTPGLKSRLAPAVFDADKARGYNAAILSGKLADLRGPAAGFRITKADATTVSAELVKGGPGKAVTLKLAKGDRLIDDIEAK